MFVRRCFMKAATIDNLDIKIHERYAQDQVALDKSFITDASHPSPHFEIAAASSMYASKWEELFETSVKNLPWASFAPPFAYHRQSNRFFSYRILPTIYVDDGNEEGEKKQDEEEKKEEEILQKALSAKKGRNQDALLFERDKTIIVKLLRTVSHLNEMLGQINSRKLQYQKG